MAPEFRPHPLTPENLPERLTPENKPDRKEIEWNRSPAPDPTDRGAWRIRTVLEMSDPIKVLRGGGSQK